MTHAIRECPDFDMSHLRYLVIDEADRMMENFALHGRQDAARPAHSSSHLNPRHSSAEATLSHDPEQLEQLPDPAVRRGGRSRQAAGGAQLVTSMQLDKVLVFTHSNDTVLRLALVLAQLGHKVGGSCTAR